MVPQAHVNTHRDKDGCMKAAACDGNRGIHAFCHSSMMQEEQGTHHGETTAVHDAAYIALKLD